ncbi:hypothetical protein [Streptomyces eurythermus]|uniref:hypothetical protein n=1 Tax=Streptomyces eurythermus TaxID=42237 RepID=UPI0036D31A3D
MAVVWQEGCVGARVGVVGEADQHLGEHGGVSLPARPVDEELQGGARERLLVALVEQRGQSQHLCTEQPVSWVWVDAQGRSGVPGVLIAAVRQKHGGSRPYGVLLVGAGQCADQQFLEGGSDVERGLQIREDRRVPVAHCQPTEGELVDDRELVVLDAG